MSKYKIEVERNKTTNQYRVTVLVGAKILSMQFGEDKEETILAAKVEAAQKEYEMVDTIELDSLN